MRIAFVASRYDSRPGVTGRHVRRLAHGLASRGAEVEVFTHDRDRRLPRVSEVDGVLVRRFTHPARNMDLALAPALWEHLRSAPSYDITHVQGTLAGLGLAVARSSLGRYVFTPRRPIEQLLRWPYARVLGAVVEQADLTICTSRAEADLMCRTWPQAADRVVAVLDGVDVAAIQAARPFPHAGKVVLAIGRLERYARMDRAIGAMPALDPAFELVVVGDGPARRSLRAHAADLGVSSRVQFFGEVSEAVLHRWLRTAAVVLALGESQASGVQLLEAIIGGTPVVASAIPAHREAAAYGDERAVVLVSPEGSPLEVADGISAVVGAQVRATAQASLPSWDAVVERTLALYQTLGPAVRVVGRWGRGSRRRGRTQAIVERSS